MGRADFAYHDLRQALMERYRKLFSVDLDDRLLAADRTYQQWELQALNTLAQEVRYCTQSGASWWESRRECCHV